MSTDDRTQTRVDLGDDLLEPTRTLTAPFESEKIEGPADKIASARILLAEGLVADAKKLYRSILLNEAEREYWGPARIGLDEILANELNLLLKPGTLGRAANVGSPHISEIEVKEIEDRWGVSDFLEAEDVLFNGDSERMIFIQNLEARLKDSTPETRLDLASALLGMTLYRVSEVVVRPLVTDSVWAPAAAELQARAWLETGRAFEATQLLEDFLSRPTLGTSFRYEFFYLIGCAFQQMNRAQEARGWFAELLRRSGGYRDVESRLKQLG